MYKTLKKFDSNINKMTIDKEIIFYKKQKFSGQKYLNILFKLINTTKEVFINKNQ